MRVFHCSCLRVLVLFLVGLSPAFKAEDGQSCETCYRVVSSSRPIMTSTTVYRYTTVYTQVITCTWRWLSRRCYYQQVPKSEMRSTIMYMMSYETVYSLKSYECNCVTIQPSSTTQSVGSTLLKKGSLSIDDVTSTTFQGVRSLPSWGLYPSPSTTANSFPVVENISDSSGGNGSIAAAVIIPLLVVLVAVTIIIGVISLVCLRRRRKSMSENGAATMYSRSPDDHGVGVDPSGYENVSNNVTENEYDNHMLLSVRGGYEVPMEDSTYAQLNDCEDLVDNTNQPYEEIGDEQPQRHEKMHGQSLVYEEVTLKVRPARVENVNGKVAATSAIYGNVPSMEAREEGNLYSNSSVQSECFETLNKEIRKRHAYENVQFQPPPNNLGDLYNHLSEMKCVEIPRQVLVFGPTLGSGEFGVVCKGEWVTPHGPREVALKVSREDVPEEEKVKLLQEAAIMKQFCHPNVVRLLGTVTISDPLVLVVEFLANGSLISLLLQIPKTMNEAKKKLFITFSQQIAEGMKYLSGKGFVHRDLAARNVLLDHEYTCKISDFGLSRNLDENTYYVVKGGKIPLRWTAPEALFYKKYSSCSDVWSYGMTLFEIWSFGKKPFEDFTMQEIIDLFGSRLGGNDHGELLSCPKHCPHNVFSLMLRCWNFDQHSRPSFAEILAALSVQ